MEKGYYHCVYVMLRFKKEVGVESKEDQAEVEDDPNQQDMEDAKLYDEKERHWRLVLEDNDGGLDDKNAFLHSKIWYV